MPWEHTYYTSIPIVLRGQEEYERLLCKHHVYWRQRGKRSLGVCTLIQPSLTRST